MLNLRFMLSLIVLVMSANAVGCQNANCVDLCTEAQAGDCTSISGDCQAFCDALDGVEEPSGCTDERTAYQDCLNDGDHVCDNHCDGVEADLETCVAAHCLTHATENDCQTLVNSF